MKWNEKFNLRNEDKVVVFERYFSNTFYSLIQMIFINRLDQNKAILIKRDSNHHVIEALIIIYPNIFCFKILVYI